MKWNLAFLRKMKLSEALLSFIWGKGKFILVVFNSEMEKERVEETMRDGSGKESRCFLN